MIDQTLIDQITRTIVERLHPHRIVLFGSHARGDAGPDSDLDLFIEMETNHRFVQRAIEVDRLFGLRTWPMDVFVYTPEEVQRWRNVCGSLVSIVESEGKVLYERR